MTNSAPAGLLGTLRTVDGTGIVPFCVEACHAPRRFLLHTTSAEEPESVVEGTLTADGEQTVLVLEDRGLLR